MSVQIRPFAEADRPACQAIAASAAHEAIYSLLMMERGFVAGCANITRLDAACAGFPLVPRTLTQPLNSVMSNSFGFGGTNACLIFRRFQ